MSIRECPGRNVGTDGWRREQRNSKFARTLVKIQGPQRRLRSWWRRAVQSSSRPSPAPVSLRLPVLRGSAWFSCTQPSGYVHDATSRRLERLQCAPPWMEPVDRRRPLRCHVGINPLTHIARRRVSLLRGGGRPGKGTCSIGFNKEPPEGWRTRLGPFRSQQARGYGYVLAAAVFRLPCPGPVRVPAPSGSG